jgi:predicted regulator of Ras-like GTPase activity (Roadblock/LC7/MglB family)
VPNVRRRMPRLGGGDWLNLDVAAAGNTEVIRAKIWCSTAVVRIWRWPGTTSSASRATCRYERQPAPTNCPAETSNDRRRTGEVTRSAAPAGHRQPADLVALAAALREVKGESDPILGGMLVAGADGLVLCAEACGTHVDMLGVMAAVAAGIASQIIANTGVVEPMACLFEGSSGHVAVSIEGRHGAESLEQAVHARRNRKSPGSWDRVGG